MLEQRSTREGLLSPYRVLDLCGQRGAWCGRLLADLGADVIKVEPPEGDATRRLPPFANGVKGERFSLYFAARNMNKRSVTLDLATKAGRELFLRLLATTDIMVEDAQPGFYEGLGLGYQALSTKCPQLIVASITDYGQTGPYVHRPGGSAMVAAAFGGLVYKSGYYEKPPCTPPGDLAYFWAGVMATTATLIALLARRRSGQGQHIDLSAVDAVGVCDWGAPGYSRTQRINHRNGPGPNYPIVKCKDGYVRVLGSITARQFAVLRQWLGDPEVLRGPQWLALSHRTENHQLIISLLEEKARDRTMVELYEEGQAMGLTITPVYQVDHILADKQYAAREAFVTVNQPGIGSFQAQRIPIKLEEEPGTGPRPAPQLGEHNHEVLGAELGLTPAELGRLKKLTSSAWSSPWTEEM